MGLALGFWSSWRGERDTAESHWDDAECSKTLDARPWEQLGQISRVAVRRGEAGPPVWPWGGPLWSPGCTSCLPAP